MSDDTDQITCWCGATGTHDELFDSEVYTRGCGGTGFIDCECGGDQCVCHHHGEVECDGCDDCGPEDDWGDDYYEGEDW
jgi:hypothetical protein